MAIDLELICFAIIEALKLVVSLEHSFSSTFVWEDYQLDNIVIKLIPQNVVQLPNFFLILLVDLIVDFDPQVFRLASTSYD